MARFTMKYQCTNPNDDYVFEGVTVDAINEEHAMASSRSCPNCTDYMMDANEAKRFRIWNYFRR